MSVRPSVRPSSVRPSVCPSLRLHYAQNTPALPLNLGSPIFKASALWADAIYKLKCPYVCVFVFSSQDFQASASV